MSEEEMDAEKGEENVFLVAPSRERRIAHRRNRRVLFFGVTIAFLIAVTIGLGVGLGLSYGLLNESESSSSTSGTYKHAAVATDAPQCSQVGVEILKKNGSAVDAAIASLLCVGVINLHSTGIGGGGFMVYYNATSKKATVIDHRETAPGRANYSMYSSFGGDETASLFGGLAIAVPGEVRGMEMAHQKYGRLPWAELFAPAAQIADEGFKVSPPIAAAINAMKGTIDSRGFTQLKELLAPNGEYLKEGETLYRKKYAQTLRNIGQNGSASYFYEGPFMEQMVKELQEAGAIIEEEDFLNYTAIEREPVETYFDGLKVLGPPPPSSGAVLALILNILHGYNFTSSDFGSLAYHRIVESFKFAFGQRLLLGDPAFNDTVNEVWYIAGAADVVQPLIVHNIGHMLALVVKFMLMNSTADDMRSRIQDNTTHDPGYYTEPMVFEVLSDYGTSHLCVLAPNGDAVAATSTINSYFGSLVRSPTSGVIFNDEMDDFSVPSRNNSQDLPPTWPNYIEPGKRPQSSTTPTIILDGEKVKMVVGASGGTKITTATAQVILDVLNFGKKLSSAIPYPRLHHQLYPDYVRVEDNFPKEYREGLEERGHKVVQSSSHAVVQGIFVEDGEIQATSDPRKGGKPAGY